MWSSIGEASRRGACPFGLELGRVQKNPHRRQSRGSVGFFGDQKPMSLPFNEI